MKAHFQLNHEIARQTCVAAILSCPLDGTVIKLSDAGRSLEQNAKFHAICEDVEKSGFHYAGKPRTAAAWKVLFVSGHAVATGLGAEVLPGLEGEFVNIRESTAKMGKARSSSLIEYTLAYCAMNNIKVFDHGFATVG